MIRTLSILLFFIGVVFIAIGYTNDTFTCPPARIEYRYIPRRIYEEQLYDQNVTQKFDKMFNEVDVSARN